MSERMRMESVDMVQKNIEKIAALFPNCVTEAYDGNGGAKRAVDFDKLKQMLDTKEVAREGGESYEFTWVGKRASLLEARKPIRKTLRPCMEESVSWDATENLYIEGDNLDVLKLLQESYLGKVKMIYIDPPYNTGNDFVYKDDFARSQRDEDEEAGLFNEEGKRLFKNTNANCRFHSDWCSMIYPRLMLARNMLSYDGVLFISIDDHEVGNLLNIANEVFGEKNRLAILVWKKKYTGGKGTSHFVDYHEYILAYAKNSACLGDISMARPEEEKEKFIQEDEYVEERGKYYTRPLKSNLDPRPTLVYPIELPDGTTVTTQWICAKDTFMRLKAEGRIEFKDSKTSKWPVYKKFYEYDSGGNIKIPSFLEVSNNNEAKEELKKIFGITQTRDLPFQTPKPTKLLELFVKNFSKAGDIILDFFSGSASTAHTVMSVNAKDKQNRHFIMVQLPELCDEKSEAFKAGYKNICEIGKERIRRAAKKIREENPGASFDGGFRVLKVDDTNMRDVYYGVDKYDQEMLSGLVSNIKDDRTDLDLLFSCVLEWGLPLSMPHTSEEMDGCVVHTYNGGDLVACFDKDVPDSVIRAIARKKPLRAVFRDSGFVDSPAKINVDEIFKLLAPETRVKVI